MDNNQNQLIEIRIDLNHLKYEIEYKKKYKVKEIKLIFRF